MMVDDERGVRGPLMNLSNSTLFSLTADQRVCKALFGSV
jgi:hypothetical protein